ncbi:MAG TPA: biotin-dependent carboxyltransferase family protein [Nocardioidaceae bacterium]|nr:biotin-dependent carboxyltransferase family protein [Nocardioidaceae bacterium]
MSTKLTVLDAGPLTTVQDLGRRGYAHLGVPRSGALDMAAAGYANRLVGNPPEAAVLETTLGGVSIQVSGSTMAAVTGAPASVTVDGRPRPFAEPLLLRAGETLTVGPAVSGLRSYLSFAGGVDATPVLGSRSTDTLSGLGPPRLTSGAKLELGVPVGESHGADVPVVLRYPDTARVRLVPGPRHDWFTEGVLDFLTSTSYTVSARSNRVGVRLEGPSLERRERAELPSEGLVLGAVQVPASGQPLVFLNDHPTTGGYPVVGVVAPEDLNVCAQLRPGCMLRFVLA